MLKILKWTAALSMMKRILLNITSTIMDQKNMKMKIIDVGKVLIITHKMELIAGRKRMPEKYWHRKIHYKTKHYLFGS